MLEIPAKEELKYPIGFFDYSTENWTQNTQNWINVIRDFPEKLDQISNGLKNELNWKYRPNGWTIKQVIQHCADSHMNGLIRTKLALTENKPQIKPYLEAAWANLADSALNISFAIQTLHGVHARWCTLFEEMNENDFSKTYFHPEEQKEYALHKQLGLYAWHCNHHFAHIEQSLKYKGTFNAKE